MVKFFSQKISGILFLLLSFSLIGSNEAQSALTAINSNGDRIIPKMGLKGYNSLLQLLNSVPNMQASKSANKFDSHIDVKYNNQKAVFYIDGSPAAMTKVLTISPQRDLDQIIILTKSTDTTSEGIVLNMITCKTCAGVNYSKNGSNKTLGAGVSINTDSVISLPISLRASARTETTSKNKMDFLKTNLGTLFKDNKLMINQSKMKNILNRPYNHSESKTENINFLADANVGASINALIVEADLDFNVFGKSHVTNENLLGAMNINKKGFALPGRLQVGLGDLVNVTNDFYISLEDTEYEAKVTGDQYDYYDNVMQNKLAGNVDFGIISLSAGWKLNLHQQASNGLAPIFLSQNPNYRYNIKYPNRYIEAANDGNKSKNFGLKAINRIINKGVRNARNTNSLSIAAVPSTIQQNGSSSNIQQNGSSSNIQQNGSSSNIQQNGSSSNIQQNGSSSNIQQNGSSSNIQQNGPSGAPATSNTLTTASNNINLHNLPTGVESILYVPANSGTSIRINLPQHPNNKVSVSDMNTSVFVDASINLSIMRLDFGIATVVFDSFDTNKINGKIFKSLDLSSVESSFHSVAESSEKNVAYQKNNQYLDYYLNVNYNLNGISANVSHSVMHNVMSVEELFIYLKYNPEIKPVGGKLNVANAGKFAPVEKTMSVQANINYLQDDFLLSLDSNFSVESNSLLEKGGIQSSLHNNISFTSLHDILILESNTGINFVQRHPAVQINKQYRTQITNESKVGLALFNTLSAYGTYEYDSGFSSVTLYDIYKQKQYQLFGAVMEVNLLDYMNIWFRCDNIFNAKYIDYLGVKQSGASVSAGVTIEL